MRRVDPGSAEDQMTAAGRLHCLLARQFALPVHAERRGGIVRPIGARALPIEDIVGRVMDQGHIGARAPLRYHARRFGIGAEGRITLLLGTIDGRVGGCVDDATWLQAIQQFAQAMRCVKVGYLTRCTIRQPTTAGATQDRAIGCQCPQQFRADLSIGSQYQRGHGVYTGRRSAGTSPRNGAAESFADNNGLLIGQSMPIAASSQRTPASASFT